MITPEELNDPVKAEAFLRECLADAEAGIAKWEAMPTPTPRERERKRLQLSFRYADRDRLMKALSLPK